MKHKLTIKKSKFSEFSVSSVAKVSIKNTKLRKTKPILSAPCGLVTLCEKTTNNKKQPTMNNEKQSQTNPKQTQSRPPVADLKITVTLVNTMTNNNELKTMNILNKPNQSQNKAKPCSELVESIRYGLVKWAIASELAYTNLHRSVEPIIRPHGGLVRLRRIPKPLQKCKNNGIKTQFYRCERLDFYLPRYKVCWQMQP